MFENVVNDNKKAKKSSTNKKAENPIEKEEAKRVLAKIEDLLSKLDNGGEFVCDNEALRDKDDVDDFALEVVYLLECGIGIVWLQGQGEQSDAVVPFFYKKIYSVVSNIFF